MSEVRTDSDQWTHRLGVFDLETTGVDPTGARIVTAFVGVVNAQGELEQGREWIVNPGIEIPAAAAAVHGISTERARAEGQEPAHAVREIHDTLREIMLTTGVVAFNAAYDFSVLHAEARRHGLEPLADPAPVIDPLVLDKQVDRYRRGKRTLGATVLHYGITLDGWHDASADAVAAGRLAFAMAERYPELRISLADLHGRTAIWSAEQDASFAEFMQRQGRPFAAQPGWPVRDAVRASAL